MLSIIMEARWILGQVAPTYPCPPRLAASTVVAGTGITHCRAGNKESGSWSKIIESQCLAAQSLWELLLPALRDMQDDRVFQIDMPIELVWLGTDRAVHMILITPRGTRTLGTDSCDVYVSFVFWQTASGVNPRHQIKHRYSPVLRPFIPGFSSNRSCRISQADIVFISLANL